MTKIETVPRCRRWFARGFKFNGFISRIKAGVRVALCQVLLLAVLIGCSPSSDVREDNLTTTTIKPPIDLTVGEGFAGSVGYYEQTPRFSWRIPSSSIGQFQSAYHIQVASTERALVEAPDLWDSGQVDSDETSWIRYEGRELESRQIFYWRVKWWDETNRASAWSEAQSIELGLLSNADWQGQWIGHPDTQLLLSPDQETLAAAQYLRSQFTLNKDIERARLYVTAKGLFKPYINGAPVSESDVMTPGWTPYATRIESLTYDVTDHLQAGENTFASSLAGGWYAGRINNFHDRDHKQPARFLAQLEVTYTNGSVQTLVSDDSWMTSIDGPIRFASIYDGETYDQAKELPGWTRNDFDTSSWSQAIEEPISDGVLISPKQHSPVRIIEMRSASDIQLIEDGVAVFDFGQNMVGVPRLKVPAVDGQEITIRFAEALHKGEFYTDNYRSAESTNRFLPDRDGEVLYQPTFTYHGFRYAEISGYDASKTPTTDWVTALVQHSDIEIHASFQSSHPKLNQLSNNIVWGLRSNFFDIPLDCPQRDERLGWTGDAQVFLTPSMYLSDSYGFWAAWLRSMREEQGPDGKIPLYVPFVDWLNFASSGWGDAATIIPWELYVATGDETILSDNYDMMKAWVQYHHGNSDNYVSEMNTFGDWLQPFPKNLRGETNGNRGDTDRALIGSAYFARSVELTIEAARVLGIQEDVENLSALHERVKQAFNDTFFDEHLNVVGGEPTQTTYLLGLAYDLFPEDHRGRAAEKLITELEKTDNHLRTGFLGTPLLAQVLQEIGRTDLVYEILFKETYPSWFFSINNGATTTWERWNSYTIEDGFSPEGMNSLNHYAYGTIARWFYEGILGINPAEPGFKRIRIAPQFGDELRAASGGYITPQGQVFVEWKRVGGEVTLEIVVPKNSRADVVLTQIDASTLRRNDERVSSDELHDLPPGSYQFSGMIAGEG